MCLICSYAILIQDLIISYGKAFEFDPTKPKVRKAVTKQKITKIIEARGGKM